jgi:hypothetical protein
MNKLDLARRLARASHRSRAQAADDVDTLVYNLLKKLEQHPQEPESKTGKKAREKISAASVIKAKP